MIWPGIELWLSCTGQAILLFALSHCLPTGDKKIIGFFFTYFSVINTGKLGLMAHYKRLFNYLLGLVYYAKFQILCLQKLTQIWIFQILFIHFIYFLLVTQSKTDENIFVLSWFSNHNYQIFYFFLHCSKAATVIWKRQKIANEHCCSSGGKFYPYSSYFKMLKMHYHRLQLLCESQFEMKSHLSRV